MKNRQKGLPVGGALRVSDSTELVIDGFQGSANSFATSAFNSIQPSSVQVCHHLHAPVQVIQAVKLKKPVIITVRDPREAVLSLVSRWEYLSVSQGLKGYIRYYRALLPHKEALVVSTFKQTTEEFGKVVHEVNKRWGTDFVEFSGEPSEILALRDMSERKKAEKKKRSQVKKVKVPEFETGANQRLLREAEEVFRSLTGGH